MAEQCPSRQCRGIDSATSGQRIVADTAIEPQIGSDTAAARDGVITLAAIQFLTTTETKQRVIAVIAKEVIEAPRHVLQ